MEECCRSATMSENSNGKLVGAFPKNDPGKKTAATLIRSGCLNRPILLVRTRAGVVLAADVGDRQSDAITIVHFVIEA